MIRTVRESTDSFDRPMEKKSKKIVFSYYLYSN